MEQAIQELFAEISAAETKDKLIKIGLQILPGQAVVGAKNKDFGITGHYVQSMEHFSIGVIGLVFMEIVF